MEFRKNDILTLDIEDCGVDGEGIGKADGFTVFVKDAVIGDRIKAKIIKAKKNYGYGRLMEVITPSPYRVKPACSIARQCGGCQLQALSYEQQLKFKEKKGSWPSGEDRRFSGSSRWKRSWEWKSLSLSKQGTVSGRKK